MGSKYKLEHDIAKCIGCQACTIVAPDYWEMGKDGLSHLKGSKKNGDMFEREIDEKDLEPNLQAARSCPVAIIHVKKSTGEEIR